MSFLIGTSKALAAATAHERTNLEESAPHNEIVMDMENNLRGCSIYQNLVIPPDSAIEQVQALIKTAVFRAADTGKLTVLDDVTNPGLGALLVPSTEQPY